MRVKKQKIPLVLKLKRLKNSQPVQSMNSFISAIKPSKKYDGVPKRILLFRNDRIGDAVVTLPVIRDIKTNYPGMIIDVLVSPANRFVFEGFEYVDNLIEIELSDNNSGGLFKVPFLGGFFLFLKFLIIPFIFSTAFRKELRVLKANNYDAAADLVGLKRNALAARYLTRYKIGPGRLAAFLFYDYYSSSNWVSAGDNDFMTRKIEQTLTDSLGLKLQKRDIRLPLVGTDTKDGKPYGNEFDIIFHFGSSGLRKLSFQKEKELVVSFTNYKILVTDSQETEGYKKLMDFFRGKANITFKVYPALRDMVLDCQCSRLLFCYDGGQSHYLSQYIRTITIFGPGSAALWKPYEFEEYNLIESDDNGTKAIESSGRFGHIAICFPMWCSPCFDTGCKDRFCINKLSTEFISNIINKYCLINDK